MKNNDFFTQTDGFQGEKLISIPDTVWKKVIEEIPILSHLYITQIGYFPKTTYHSREQTNGSPDNILIYCVQGKGWYKVNDKHYEVKPNHFFILPATTEYSIFGADKNDPWSIYLISFSSLNIDIFNQSFNINTFNSPQQIAFNEKGIELWNMIYQNLEMGYDKENISKANLSLYQFVSSFLFPDKDVNKKKHPEKDLINSTIVYMRTKLSNKLTLEDLAIRNDLSPSHFSLLFRKATSMSPLDYFIHLKLQYACLLLTTSEVKVKNIAADLGYDDSYYFSRLFKKHMKISPLQYRFSYQSKSEKI